MVLGLLVGLTLIAEGPGAAAQLERAKELALSLKFKDVVGAAERALAMEGNDRATVLAALELKGVAQASLKQHDLALATFVWLLTIEPAFELHGKYAPRVTTPFYEARTEVKRRGALEVEAAWVDGAVRVRVKSDPLKLLVAARVHLRRDAEPWQSTVVPLAGAEARHPVKAQGEVTFWVEALGANTASLVAVASKASPVTQRLAPDPGELRAPVLEPVVALAQPTVAPPPTITPSGAPLEVAAPVEHPLRTTAFVALGLGAAAAGGGAVFGLVSKNGRDQFNRSVVDGQVIGLSPVDAQSLEQRTVLQAWVANAFFIAAGALAVTGTVLWLLDGHLAVAPTGNGVVVLGVTP